MPDDQKSQTVFEPEVMEPELARPESALQVRTQWTKEELNPMVMTAQKVPRDLARFHKNMALTIKEMDEKDAEKINFHAPMGQKKRLDAKGNAVIDPKTRKEIWDTEYADGMSIRMAELVYSNYGHIMFKQDSWSDDKYAYGVCFAWDYQANNACSVKKAYSITYSAKGNRPGGRYSENMVAKTMLKAQATALRDAIFKLVPKILYEKYGRMALEKVVGTPEELPHKVNKFLSMLSNIGQVDRQRIVELLGFATEAEIDTEGLKTLIKTISALTTGEMKMEEAFPPDAPPVSQQPGVDGATARMQQAQGTAPTETVAPPAETKAPVPETKAPVAETAKGPKKVKPDSPWSKKPVRVFDPATCPQNCANIKQMPDGSADTCGPCDKAQVCPKET